MEQRTPRSHNDMATQAEPSFSYISLIVYSILSLAPSSTQDFILRQRGVTTIALGGFLTNCCVESTMRSAYERGYQVFTLKDCVATTR